MNHLSPSYVMLKPSVLGLSASYYVKEFERDWQRVSGIFPNIPKEAYKELFFPFWGRSHFDLLYGYLDFSKVKFELIFFSNKELEKTGWYSEFDRTESVSEWSIEDFEELYRFQEEVVNEWRLYGSWLEPIWILDSNSFVDCKLHPEVKRPFMLVEGHTRLGVLNIMKRTGRVVDAHKVWKISYIK